MAKYNYPAIFTKNEHGCYSINFPDIEGLSINTNYIDIEDAKKWAEKVLCFELFEHEEELHKFQNSVYILEPKPINMPTDLDLLEIPHGSGSEKHIISCDTEHCRVYSNKQKEIFDKIERVILLETETKGVALQEIESGLISGIKVVAEIEAYKKINHFGEYSPIMQKKQRTPMTTKRGSLRSFQPYIIIDENDEERTIAIVHFATNQRRA